MAIAFDAGSSTSSDGSASTISWNHTVAAGSDMALVVYVYTSNDTAVSGVTYNGDAMTQVFASGFTSTQACYMFRLVAPDSGTHAVTVTYAAAVTYRAAGALSFSGVNQSSPVGGSGSLVQYTSTITASVNVAEATSYIVDGSAAYNVAPNANSGQTGGTSTTSAGFKLKMGYKVTPGTGAQTASYTLAGPISYTIGALELKEAVASGPANLKTFLGVAKASVKTMYGLAIASVKTINGLS